MSNSPLVSYTKISPNKTTSRNHKIDTITIHCVVGQVTVESLGNIFADPNRKASSNYGVGKDGRIGMYVEEKDRSWCSSNSANDHRAITIEVASDTKHPYAVTDAAYKGLIDLLVDICKRNEIRELKWKADKSLIGKVEEQNMTVHRWFANKSCPGEYLYERHGQIAKEVNARLGVQEESKPSKPVVETPPVTPEKPEGNFRVKVSIPNLNIRKGPGTNYGTHGRFTGIGVFTIVDVKTGKGSTKGWGLLKAYEKNRSGWISLDYAKRM